MRNRYHPVKQKLENLKWDGKKRIRFVLKHFLGADTSDYTYAVMRLFLLGAIDRVQKPGGKFEYMPCLAGGQGVGKSTFVRFLNLNDEWFSDDIKRLDDERVYEHLCGHWCFEIPELEAFQKTSSNEATKAFLSRQKDNYRVPYDRRAEDHPRQAVFIGTTNIINFLPVVFKYNN